MKTKVLTVCVGVVVLALVSTAHAGVDEFTDEAGFRYEAGVRGLANDEEKVIDFESYVDGTPVTGQPTISGNEWSDWGVEFAAIESGAVLSLYENLTKEEYHSATHTLMPSGDRSSILITLPQPVLTFGMYIVDNEITSATELIILEGSDGAILGEFAMPVDPNGTTPPLSVDFRGYISDTPIAKVYVIEDSDGEGLSLDDVMYSVPEPATLGLLALGGLALLRRKE